MMTGQHSCSLCPMSSDNEFPQDLCALFSGNHIIPPCPPAIREDNICSPFLPKTFAVSLAMASQYRDDLPCLLTRTALQPGNAFPWPRHFPSSHLPWRWSCLCETKTDSEAHSVFPSHYSSIISTSAEIHLPHKYLASFKFSFFCSTPSLHLILLFLFARQSF